MIAVWIALGVVAGFGAGFALAPALARPRGDKRIELRGERTEVRHLEEVIEAARAAALRVRLRPDGFDIGDQPPSLSGHTLSVRVADAARVELGSLRIKDSGSYDLFFPLALALVPLYGPVLVTDGDGHAFRVDGTLDQHALRNEKADRVTARLRELVSRMR